MTFDRDGFYSEVGKRMRIAREREGETQAELAEALGLPRSTYANMEHGRQRTPADVLWRVSRHYCVPVETLVPGRLKRFSEPEGWNRSRPPGTVDLLTGPTTSDLDAFESGTGLAFTGEEADDG